VNLSPADGHSFFFEREPRGDVGVVIQARNQNFVAGTKLASADLPTKAAGNGVGQRGHVRAEDNFVGATVQKVAHGGAGFAKHGVGVAAGSVGPASIGVVVPQVIRDRVDHPLRHLRSAGAIEEHHRMSVDSLG